jgi:hypothetical protein
MGNPTSWVQGSFEAQAQDATNTFLLVGSGASLFGPYLNSTKIYKCPGDRVPGTGGFKNRVRSYAMNAHMGWSGPEYRGNPNKNWRVYIKSSEFNVVSPSQLLYFMEVHPDNICRPFFGVIMDRDAFYHYPASHHAGGAVNSFADSHVEFRKWKDKRTVRAANADTHSHAENSPGNQDIRWLQERVSSPVPR